MCIYIYIYTYIYIYINIYIYIYICIYIVLEGRRATPRMLATVETPSPISEGTPASLSKTTLKSARGQISSQLPTDATRFWLYLYGSWQKKPSICLWADSRAVGVALPHRSQWGWGGFTGRNGGGVTSHQISEWDQIASSNPHDLYWSSPESGDLCYKSGGQKTTVRSHPSGWWRPYLTACNHQSVWEGQLPHRIVNFSINWCWKMNSPTK